jgi:hypothetical protein
MIDQNKTSFQSRRLFLAKSIPVCGFACLGLSRLSAGVSAAESNQKMVPAHKFNKKVDWSYEEAYRQKFGVYVDRLNRIANYIGREKLIDALKKSTEEFYTSIESYESGNTLQDFVRPFYEDDHYKTILTIEIIENREDLVSWKISECLNAKIFRELDAVDIGYATLCHGDEAWVKAYNPKIRFIRTKTLMEGHDCCDHCYIMGKG